MEMSNTHPCPHCGNTADIVGGFNDVSYIQCDCGYYGDHWEDNGIVYDVPVPTVQSAPGLTCRSVNHAAYERRIAEIEVANRDKIEAARAAEAARRREATPWR
jgi:hypothetical protein